ncbi:hypothetical protein ASD56_08900 [Microbacterium sp. Root166]|uniref:hypothetical protein n=1 Tax=Microbacterium sp. Root166 TaxID=1736478 RepID=UPI0006F981D6|nr:hypothetical protein [Microbacterium sp. Root166]KQZ84122.1 hypothetical protein ASD56_08900 [Microbacterium sp. Root166]
MPENAPPADFELRVSPTLDAPAELQEIARLYWEHDGLDPYGNGVLWTRKTTEIDFKPWSGTVHYAAAAGGVATSRTFDCPTCGEPLTLSSRQTLADARRGLSPECRKCNGTINERAAAVLDPSTVEKRQGKAKADKRERAAAEAARENDALRVQEEAALEQMRRAAIAAQYPSETEDPGEYDLVHASVTDKVGALAVIQALGFSSGLVHVGRYAEADIAPTVDMSVELLAAAWRARLLLVHPSSPSNAFVWSEDDPAELGSSIYTERTNFTVPGGSTLARRMEQFAGYLRDHLELASLWSTQRRELRDLAKTLVAEEAIRYFRHQLADHGFPDPAEHHLETLRSHAERGSRHFSLGQLYRMAWTSARNAASAYERNRGMSKEKAAAHGVNSFVGWVQRGLDAPAELGDHFREDFELPLTAATDVVFRVVLDLSPMRALPGDIDAALEGSPDEELRRACNDRIPDRHEVMEWLRTNAEWEPDDFRSGLERVGGEDFELCGPGCAHERAPMVAYQSSRLIDRIVSRVGARDAAVVTAEAMSIGNENDYRGRSGDLVLAHVARALGWTSADREDDEREDLPVAF